MKRMTLVLSMLLLAAVVGIPSPAWGGENGKAAADVAVESEVLDLRVIVTVRPGTTGEEIAGLHAMTDGVLQ